MTPNRQDTLRDKIATVIQEGYVVKKTSDEIAGEVIAAIEGFIIGTNSPAFTD